MDSKSLKKLCPEEKKLYCNSKSIFDSFIPPTAVHSNTVVKEKLQSVQDWKSYVQKHKLLSLSVYRRNLKHKIYVCLIGPFPDYILQEGGSSGINFKEALKTFVGIFFPGMNVVFMDGVIDHRNIKCTTRCHAKSGQRQLYLPDINLFLCQIRPKDAFCICGFSWFDFYPSDDLNHILGEGRFDYGTVAFSFGHYSKFKEKLQWQGDIVMEPSIEVDDSLSKNDSTKTSSSYIYITYREMEEAKKNINEFEHSCASPGTKLRASSSVKSNSPKTMSRSSSTGRLNSLVRKVSKQSFTSADDQPQSLVCADGNNTSFTDDEIVMSDVSDISIVDVEEKVTEAVSDLDKDEWDPCEEVGSSFTSFKITNLENFAGENQCNDFIESALPPGCQFNFTCKLLRRLFRVITHEICHVMGMLHCQYFNCTMNASTSVLQVDSQPLFLCSICLRKLQIKLKFNVLERYKQMEGFLMQNIDFNCMCRQTNHHQHDETVFSNVGPGCDLKTDLIFVKNIIDFMTQP